MKGSAPTRGQIYNVDIGHGPQPWLIVSNDRRNRLLRDVLMSRITTTGEDVGLPTWVKLSSADPVVGIVMADELRRVDRDQLGPLLGKISPATVLAVNAALKLALAIP
ncbi:type II toxin-antitoxin system PemK/MazF family toxin [Nocardia sp. NPDC051756]|uniref:type II toxin-antitoxin system PemK/MazF family toxin n=1 Tax=Nocardia sp. NPDC051756 TaxID=3154751 RepID=UPI00341CC1A4